MNKINNITAVVTTFNDSKTIAEFLDSVSNQTILPDKMIIVDGGSNDNTVDVIKNYALSSLFQIDVISDGQRRNISEGFNTGIKFCKTKWVLILGTGNAYNPDLLKEFVNCRDSSSSQVYYSSIIGVEKTKFARIFNQYFLRGNRLQDLDASNHAVLIDKNVFKTSGFFWERFIYAGEDFEYFARLRKDGVTLKYVKEAIAYWDTPQTWQEYLKKMKVNSIADWQIESKSKVWFRCFYQLSLFIFLLVSFIVNPFLILLFPLIIVGLGIKKKTNNFAALLLGLFNRYVMVYFYFKNRKYSDAKYHFVLE